MYIHQDTICIYTYYVHTYVYPDIQYVYPGLWSCGCNAGLPSEDRRFKPVHGYIATPFSKKI